MKRVEKFMISKNPYAVDMSHVRRRLPDADWDTPWVVDAVWFRRKSGALMACVGYLWDWCHDGPPVDALDFLGRGKGIRRGGDCCGRAPTLVNLTPYPVSVYGPDGQVIVTVPASGTVARLAETTEDADPIGPIAATTVRLGHIEGLPAPVDGTVYIVSMPLLMGMSALGVNRPDCVYPFGQVRDGSGRIIGCRSLARITTD